MLNTDYDYLESKKKKEKKIIFEILFLSPFISQPIKKHTVEQNSQTPNFILSLQGDSIRLQLRFLLPLQFYLYILPCVQELPTKRRPEPYATHLLQCCCFVFFSQSATQMQPCHLHICMQDKLSITSSSGCASRISTPSPDPPQAGTQCFLVACVKGLPTHDCLKVESVFFAPSRVIMRVLDSCQPGLCFINHLSM